MARLFVQFMHPGPEPWCGENESGICEWNTTEHHRRKCIRADIRCWDRTRNVETGAKEMYFWGEWEASSEYKLLHDSRIGMPRAVHEIIPPRPGSRPLGGQNTDPFVFGDHFIYTVCHQPCYSCLRNLEEGSIIAFGSRLKGGEGSYFGLDTLFVVGRRSISLHLDKDKRPWSDLIRNEQELYETMTIEPLDQSIRIYAASMVEDMTSELPVFSFVPCHSEPFARPRLPTLASEVDPVSRKPRVNENLSQGIKNTPLLTLEDSVALWKKIVDDLETQNIELGTRVLLRDEVTPT